LGAVEVAFPGFSPWDFELHKLGYGAPKWGPYNYNKSGIWNFSQGFHGDILDQFMWVCWI
jgi:hypothetical protein